MWRHGACDPDAAGTWTSLVHIPRLSPIVYFTCTCQVFEIPVAVAG